jgi:hypothetical protein
MQRERRINAASPLHRPWCMVRMSLGAARLSVPPSAFHLSVLSRDSCGSLLLSPALSPADWVSLCGASPYRCRPLSLHIAVACAAAMLVHVPRRRAIWSSPRPQPGLRRVGRTHRAHPIAPPACPRACPHVRPRAPQRLPQYSAPVSRTALRTQVVAAGSRCGRMAHARSRRAPSSPRSRRVDTAAGRSFLLCAACRRCVQARRQPLAPARALVPGGVLRRAGRLRRRPAHALPVPALRGEMCFQLPEAVPTVSTVQLHPCSGPDQTRSY